MRNGGPPSSHPPRRMAGTFNSWSSPKAKGPSPFGDQSWRNATALIADLGHSEERRVLLTYFDEANVLSNSFWPHYSRMPNDHACLISVLTWC